MALKYLAFKEDHIVRDVYVMDRVFENNSFRITDLRYMSLEQAVEEDKVRMKDTNGIANLFEKIKSMEENFREQPDLAFFIYVIYCSIDRTVLPLYQNKTSINKTAILRNQEGESYCDAYYIEKINSGEGNELIIL